MNILNRRVLLQSGIAASSLFTATIGNTQDRIASILIQQHDEQVKRLLEDQITDRANRWVGGYPDTYGLVNPHSAANLLKQFVAAYVCEQSTYYQKQILKERIQLAVEHLNSAQHESGNIDLLTTNFNSPPDTGFVVHNVGSAAFLAKQFGEDEIVEWIKPFLVHAGKALSVGGIHTPNHRWVVCAALAQIHEVFPNETYVKRIEEWLAEGIDIDGDGMYTERSTTVYNAVTDNALVTIAHKLNRYELLEPVRKNLDAMQYLLHPNGEVVTEISRRQDLNTRGDMRRYWFALRFMAVHDENGKYASMLNMYEPQYVQLATLMEYPNLKQSLPKLKPLPSVYTKEYPVAGITRIHDGKMSATVIHGNSSRFFSMHYGDAVINAVRFASAFFGKGQFIPQKMEERDGGYYFEQSMSAPYYQPLDPSRKVEAEGGAWSQSKLERKQTEICELKYEVFLKRIDQGFEIQIKAFGTDKVPLAVEISLREGGSINGVSKIDHTKDAFLLSSGMAEYIVGDSRIRFGPGVGENTYVQVRGAEEKLLGPSVYLTGYTPFEHTLRFVS
jgi:hypothetical protein